MDTTNPSRILLIYDIDETLIYSTTERLKWSTGFVLWNYFVYKRPHLEELLVETHKYFDLALWSSGTEDYVARIAENILPEGVAFRFTWSREHCTPQYDREWNDYYYLKKLKKLERQGYPLSHILMVEDTPRNLKQNYSNGIIVSKFNGEPDDELLQLKNYLLTLKDLEDVRKAEKRGWRRR